MNVSVRKGGKHSSNKEEVKTETEMKERTRQQCQVGM